MSGLTVAHKVALAAMLERCPDAMLRTVASAVAPLPACGTGLRLAADATLNLGLLKPHRAVPKERRRIDAGPYVGLGNLKHAAAGVVALGCSSWHGGEGGGQGRALEVGRSHPVRESACQAQRLNGDRVRVYGRWIKSTLVPGM